MNSPTLNQDMKTNKIEESIRKILESYNMPDSYLEHETNKWKALLTSEVERVIGEDEDTTVKFQGYFGETMDSMLAISHKKMIRNELRAEQRKALSELPVKNNT